MRTSITNWKQDFPIHEEAEDLARFLAAREGWGFELRITDPLE